MILLHKSPDGNAKGNRYDVCHRTLRLGLLSRWHQTISILNIGSLKNHLVNFPNIVGACWGLRRQLKSHLRQGKTMSRARNVGIRHRKNINATVEILLKYFNAAISDIHTHRLRKKLIVDPGQYAELITLALVKPLVDSSKEFGRLLYESHSGSNGAIVAAVGNHLFGGVGKLLACASNEVQHLIQGG